MINRCIVPVLCLALVLGSAAGSSFLNLYAQHQNSNQKHQRDYTLDELKNAHYFSEYLEKNDLEGARTNGLVNLESEKILGSKATHDFKSYAGYFTVDKQCNSNLYTWFFQNKNASAPVLLWLQGGPGASSMFGLFAEIGPYYVDKDMQLNYRDYAWTNDYSILFVDNPVGAGFSYTGRDECYARNQTQVSRDLFNLLTQFFTVFPALKTNDFYIVGESYGGKYVPYLAYTIHQKKEIAQKYFNFVGIAVGDGWTDPINQIGYSDLLYQIGLLDANQQAQMRALQEEIVDLITKKEWLKAFDAQNKLVDGAGKKFYPVHPNIVPIVGGDLGTVSMFTNFTGMTYYFNFLNGVEPAAQVYFEKYLKQDKIRNLINVGNHSFNDGSKVESFMKEDVVQSVANELVEVIKNYKVMLYNGQLDIIVAPVVTEAFLAKLNWTGVNSYLKAPKRIWKVKPADREIAGYVKSVEKSAQRQFHYVTVRNAGHILPFDKPVEAQDLIRRFINNQLPKN